MSEYTANRPLPREVKARWAQLPRRRQTALLRGRVKPASRDEAVTALAFARHMLKWNLSRASLGALASAVMVVALYVLTGGGLSEGLLNAPVGLGVGLGLWFSQRRQARRLERNATEALSGRG